VVVTQKIVSKAEGQLVAIDAEDPPQGAPRRVRVGSHPASPRELLITETRHGFICANAGVDLSNVAEGQAALLPVDPDRSARRLRADLGRLLGASVGVVVSDTFGRTWRRGVTDVAIGCAGVAAVLDLRERTTLRSGTGATEVCVADEIAGAAELVMGKATGVPVAIVRGLPAAWLRDGSVEARSSTTGEDSSAEPQAGLVRTESMTARTPSPSSVHGRQPSWMPARSTSSTLRSSSPARPGA